MRLGLPQHLPPPRVPPCAFPLPGPTAKPTCLELHETQPSLPFSSHPARILGLFCSSGGLPAPLMPSPSCLQSFHLASGGWPPGAVGLWRERGAVPQLPWTRVGGPEGCRTFCSTLTLEHYKLGSFTRKISCRTELFRSSPTFEPVYTFASPPKKCVW